MSVPAPAKRGAAREPVRLRSGWLLATLVTALLGPSGCAQRRTQFVVLVTTDTSETAVRALLVRCAHDWDGISAVDPGSCDFEWRRGCSEAQVSLPASFGVLVTPERLAMTTDRRRLTFVVESQGDPNHRRIVRANPADEMVAWFTLRLAAACGVVSPTSASHPCPTGAMACTQSRSCEELGRTRGMSMTCGDNGACRTIDLNSSEVTVGAAPVVSDVCGADATPG